MTDRFVYFVGGVPAGTIFKMAYDSMFSLVESYDSFTGSIDSSENVGFSDNTLYELCLIGLLASSEAFFKNQFASLINIYNGLIFNLTKNKELKIDVVDILKNIDSINYQIGFIIAEELDFGSASKINVLFNDLINITPFSKDEIIKYNKLHADRNLLVHHGGIYSKKYLNQNFKGEELKFLQYMHSLKIEKQDYQDWANFVLSIVRKTCKSNKEAIERLLKEKNIQQFKEKEPVINLLVDFV